MNDLASDKKIRWYHWTLSYLSWIVTVASAFIIFFMARTAIRILSFDFIRKEWMEQGVAVLFEKVIIIIVGLVILGFIVFVQDYFYKALEKNLLLKRVLRILGIELLIIFLLNIFIVIPQCFSPEGINLLLLIGAELIVGVVLTIFSFRSNEVKSP
jgi:hypothetical protein